MFTLESLQLFCDLVESQSFTRAAERNHLSQSAVSQRLRAVERHYGQTLIERGQGRGQVEATAAGRILYQGARRLLRDASALDVQMRELTDQVGGTIRVATVYSVGLHALPPRLKPFLVHHPSINVHLEYKPTDAVYHDVMSGAVDVGIVACPTPRRGIEIVPFAEEEMAVISAPEHKIATKLTVRLRDLDGLSFIGFDTDIPTRKLVEGRLAAKGVRVRVTATFDNIETIKSVVEIGTGISILPIDTVRQEVRAGALVAVPFDVDDAFRRPTGLLVKKARARRGVIRTFLEEIPNNAPR
jgi:DNA-binding transcriptional LysR family regulator